MNKTELIQLINSTQGRFFSMTFEKKDGTITSRDCRAKDLKSLAGGEDKLAHTPYVKFYDQNSKGWRCVHPDRLIELKCGKKIHYKRD